MGTYQLDPVFHAVLEDERALARVLGCSPGLALARMATGYLVESIPHGLYEGDTPLHLAAASLRPAAARLLLQYGADPNATNRRGATPLHYASDPRPKSGGVWNPAAQEEVIALLVAGGARIDAVDRGGVSALHRAVRARSPAAVAQLLRNGASIRAVTGRGSTPMQLALRSTGASGTAGAVAEQREIIDLLIRHGG